MKKIYLGAFVSLFTAGMSMAQVLESPYSFDNHKFEGVEQAPSDFVSQAKALGVTFWTNDFSNAADWTTDNDGEPSPFGWNIGTTVNTWWATFQGGINSTSGGEFAEVYNGNYNTGNQAIGVTYTMTTSNPINVVALGGTDQVSLSFQQYGALFNDGQRVLVSTNGTTFTEVYSNNDRTVYVGNNPTAAFANPETVSANIAAAIAANPTTVWIRFEWTSRFASSVSPGAWTTFGWFIDDVALTTNPDNDLAAKTPYWGSTGLNYYKIPVSQQTGIDFTANAFNNGLNTQTDAMLNVNITGAATFSGSSPAGVDIAVGAEDSLVLSTPFTPNGLGTYNVAWNVSQNEIDDIPTDNVLAPFSFDVTNFEYARNKATQSGTFFNSGELFILGSYYDVFAADNIYSIDVRIASTAIVGSIVNARVYSLDPNGTSLATALILEDQSLDHTIVAADLGTMLNLDLISGQGGFPLNAGETYFIAVASDGDGGLTNGAVIGTAGTAEAQTCFLYDGPDDTWYYTLNTPMVQMNLNPASNTIGLNENSQLYGALVFPNPATDHVSVRYTLGAASDVTVKVVDITGKEIAFYAEGTQTEGTHQLDMNTAAFAEGVYYVTIASGDSSTTKKIVKK